tara:strand:- start:14 stop:274 length:261 start_codon:yes stop_codon:yes gene_type:complete
MLSYTKEDVQGILATQRAYSNISKRDWTAIPQDRVHLLNPTEEQLEDVVKCRQGFADFPDFFPTSEYNWDLVDDAMVKISDYLARR